MTAVFVPEKPSRFTRVDVSPDAGTPAPDDATARDTASGVVTSPVRRRRTSAGTSAVDTGTPAVEAPAPRPRRAAAFRPIDDPVTRPADAVHDEPVREESATEEGATEEPAPEASASLSSVEGYVLFQVGLTTFSVSVVEVREIVRATRLELLPDAHAQYGHGVALVDARGRSIPVVDLRADRDSAGEVLLPMWRHQLGLVVDRVLAVQTPRELVHEHDEVPAALPSYARGVLRPVAGGDPVLLIAMPDALELQADSARTDGTRYGADVLGELGLDTVAVLAPDSGAGV